ncbi:MAG: hypothetical protein QXQ71_02635, partial [Desulfurococcaceae archaeon]
TIITAGASMDFSPYSVSISNPLSASWTRDFSHASGTRSASIYTTPTINTTPQGALSSILNLREDQYKN